MEQPPVPRYSSTSHLLMHHLVKDNDRQIHCQGCAELDGKAGQLLDLCNLDERESHPLWKPDSEGCFLLYAWRVGAQNRQSCIIKASSKASSEQSLAPTLPSCTSSFFTQVCPLPGQAERNLDSEAGDGVNYYPSRLRNHWQWLATASYGDVQGQVVPLLSHLSISRRRVSQSRHRLCRWLYHPYSRKG